ncbi:MAG TPA: alkaline phosphatase family protein [Acidimicrobiales bacterium]|nr:alkaline phosphatase family protein [Acidimicrobiales bacterium]
MPKKLAAAAACLSAVSLVAVGLLSGFPLAGRASASGIWRPAHTVVVIMETYGYDQIIGSSQAPYINSLANANALLTNYHSIGHPSEPNYLELFSGSTQGDTTDDCPLNYSAANLYTELAAAKLSFAAYSEGAPGVGYRGCATGGYVRRHDPWADFTNVPGSVNLPFSSFPANYSQLPTVSYVIPNLVDDMHDASPPQGDAWLRAHIDPYVRWAKQNNSLLILVWDEADDNANNNQVAAVLAGSNVVAGKYATGYTHASLLRTIEDAYGLAPLGNTASAAPIAVFSGGSTSVGATPTTAARKPVTRKPVTRKPVKKRPARRPVRGTSRPSTASFNFENGTTQGWRVDYGPVAIANTASIAYSGTRSLAIRLTGAGNPGIASPHLPGVGAGSRVTYHVYEPASMSLAVQPYAEDGAWKARLSTTVALRRGGWTTITWTVPALSGGLRYIGLEVENGPGQRGTLALDDVSA